MCALLTIHHTFEIGHLEYISTPFTGSWCVCGGGEGRKGEGRGEGKGKGRGGEREEKERGGGWEEKSVAFINPQECTIIMRYVTVSEQSA